MTKYRLKKDLPDLEAGEIFDDADDFGHESSAMFDSTGTYRFDKDDIKHFDEWFEEVPDEWPRVGKPYYVVRSNGSCDTEIWRECQYAKDCQAIGNVFKTSEAAVRFVDYLEAIATVRQDEGVLTPDDVRKTLARDGTVYTIGINRQMVSVKEFYNTSAGAVYFDTGYNAKTSCEKHQDEWMTIANYDWSRE